MFDTHAHLYLNSRSCNELVQNAKNVGLKGIINIGINIETSLQALAQSRQFPEFIFPTIGIHPCETQGEHKITQIKDLSKTEPFVAIGEIGLDYYKMGAPKENQCRVFEAQMQIALETNLPVVIHNRHADDDIKSVLDNFPKVRRVLHCYASSWEFAEQVLNDYTYFSFTGMITYSKKGKVIRALKEIPLSHIMIETDSPYLTPKRFQGQENQPSYVMDVCERVAEVKKIEHETLIQHLENNTKNFFFKPLG